MLSAYTGAQIRAAEAPMINAGHGDALMQRAAHGLYGVAVEELRTARGGCYGRTAVVLAGSGNNGGDALYAGARLIKRGVRTTAVLTSKRAHEQALAAFISAGGRVERLGNEAVERLVGLCARADLLIDGILGTGAEGGMREPAASLVRRLVDETSAAGARYGAGRAGAARGPGGINPRRRGVVMACDLPSGVNADTGDVHGPVLDANITVTFGGAKLGLLTGRGAQAAGRVIVVDIGLGPELPDPAMRRLQPAEAAELYPQPQPADHKYSRGVLGIAAGSAQYPGAGILATGAALATGVGMVRYLGPSAVASTINILHPEAVCSQDAVDAVHVQAWLVGPGAGEDPEQQQRARDAITSGLPTVVDASALVLLPGKVGPQVILTPHAGELRSLLAARNIEVERTDIEAAPAAYALQAAQLTGATVLLKGFTTITAAPTGELFSQAEATPWLATAGSGDTLAGMLGALAATLADDDGAAERLGIPAAAKWAAVAAAAAMLHGLAGQRAARRGPVVVGSLPGDIGAVIADLFA